MKRFLFLIPLLLCLLFSPAVLASTEDARIVAPDTTKITAPFSGILLPFDWNPGDSVSSSDLLFAYQTVPIYAPESGKLVAILASAGDDAADVLTHYGSLAIIEPIHPLYIDASNNDAYDKEENKYLHAGELLYLKDGNDKGTGRVVSVDESHYTVEILTGSYDPEDTVRCFRESGYSNDSETGRGKVRRYRDITVSGQGRILSIRATEGTMVKTGDLLFETLDSQALPGESTDISTPVSGVISSLYVSSGQQVYRGQLLCEIMDLRNLELSVEMDEVDLPFVRIGDMLSFKLDAYPERTFSGNVLRINPIGTKKQNATYYDVRLSISADTVQLYPGMNGTVTIR